MRLPDFITVNYDPRSMKYYSSVDVDKYNRYLIRRTTDDLVNTVEQNEIRTGLLLMLKIWRMVNMEKSQPFCIKEDDCITLYNYKFYWHHYFSISLFSREDLECFWFVLSRYYPFDDEEIEEYMKYLNVKELEKNMFIDLSDDQWNMIKCYEELNK
jgi:hypothetical protein